MRLLYFGVVKKYLFCILLLFACMPMAAQAGTCWCIGGKKTDSGEYWKNGHRAEICYTGVPDELTCNKADQAGSVVSMVTSSEYDMGCKFNTAENCEAKNVLTTAYTPPPTVPTVGTTDPLKDLLIKSPGISIKIPGLDFSNINKPDEQGYLYIPWIAEYMTALYKFALGIVSVIAVIMIIVQGARIVTSGGGQQKTDAYKKILQAIVGLFIAWGSYAILYNVNPDLVKFNALKVKYVTPAALEDIVDSPNTDLNSSSGGGVAGNCNSYDNLFQKYAPCLKTDWKIMKAIASVESGCNPTIGNSSGYMGMGQTNVKNCVAVMNARGYSKWADYCTAEKLKTPEVGIAMIALTQRGTAALLKKYCPNAPANMQGAMFHAYHNMPAAALRMIKGDCTNQNLFINYFNTDMNKKSAFLNDKSYLARYGNILQSQGEDAYLKAIGAAKIKYAIDKAGPAFASMGGNISEVPSGQCPLDTDKPF
jgi:hypothetical protein